MIKKEDEVKRKKEWKEWKRGNFGIYWSFIILFEIYDQFCI